MSDKPWNELTKEDIGLRPIREDERTTTEVKDWRGAVVRGEVGPERPRSCGETIYAGRASYHCGKDAAWVRDESRWNKKKPDYLCGQHAAGALRSAKTDARKDAERAEAQSGEAHARKRLAEIEEVFGIELDLDYRWTTREYSTTMAVVSIEDLERIADDHSDCVPLEQA